HRGGLHLPLGDRLPRPAARWPGEHADLRGDPAARAGLRLAEGGPHVAMKPPVRQPGDTASGANPRNLPAVTEDQRDLVVPIVVPNTLWQAADPEAYDGGRESDI